MILRSMIVKEDVSIKLKQSFLNPFFNLFAQIVIGWGFGMGVVRFENILCAASSGLDGTCYTRRQCNDMGGIISGKCASGVGACCVIQASCGDSMSENNTYFINDGFPNSFIGGSVCTLTVTKDPDANICQIRVDLLTFILAQPNGEGVCATDSLMVAGGSRVPSICGENTGQHFYVDFNGNNNIRLIVTTRGIDSISRVWKIQVAYIGCDCPSRAPTGCLQYYTDNSATVQSFNYGRTISSEITMGALPGTRQLANTNYGVCVAPRAGFCTIRWEQEDGDLFSFTVTGGTIGLTGNGEVGTPPAGMSGATCNTDFVIVPNNNLAVERFCGNYFPTVTTSSRPFVLTVVTDGTEGMDNGNRGFSLTYTQLRCDNPIII